MSISALFNPRSVVVIGAAPEPTRVGYALMKNLLGGSGRTIIPVTDKYADVLGVPCVPSVASLHDGIDLAVIAVKASQVPDALSTCAVKGIHAAVIISAGFKEEGPEGKALEDEITRIARAKEITLIGPNCLGVVDTATDLNASFVAEKPIKGHVGFISQSGAIGTALLDWARAAGVGFSKFVSLGNEAGTTETDMMEFFADDPDTRAVLMYLEKVSDGEKFRRAARKITTAKPLIILRAGRSARGSAAVRSHTGSLAPDDAVFDAACRESGAVTVETLRDLFSFAKILHMDIRHPLARIAVVTNGGGPSVNATDLIDLSHSLELAVFSEETRSALRAVLPPMAAVGNPVDVIGDATAKRYADTLKIVAALPDVDGIIVIVTPQMMTDPAEIARAIIATRTTKPVIPVFMGGRTAEPGIAVLRDAGLVNFDIPTDAIIALDELAMGAAKVPQSVPPSLPSVETKKEEMLPARDMKALLEQYSLPLSGVILSSEKDIDIVVPRLGNGPYAMKALSQAIVHKSDAGAVVTGLQGVGEIRQAWKEMNERIRRAYPEAVLDGMLLQRMEKGVEMIVGMKRDATFGPVILVGLGGIYAEAMKDTMLGIAPLTPERAQAMIHSLRGAGILKGLRGQPPINEGALVAILTRLSFLALDHSEISSIDLNPVIVSPEKAAIVDARVMVRKGE